MKRNGPAAAPLNMCGKNRTLSVMSALLALAPARTVARIDAPGAVTAGPQSLEVDLSHHFRAFGAEGAFVLHDLPANRLVVHDATRASRAPYDLRGWVQSVEAASWRV